MKKILLTATSLFISIPSFAIDYHTLCKSPSNSDYVYQNAKGINDQTLAKGAFCDLMPVIPMARTGRPPVAVDKKKCRSTEVPPGISGTTILQKVKIPTQCAPSSSNNLTARAQQCWIEVDAKFCRYVD